MVLIVITCILTYTNSLWGQLVSDDQTSIGLLAVDYRNPQTIVKNLEFKLWGYNPFPYHLTNLILHFIACILLLKIMRLFFKRVPALIGTLFFCVLPVHTENVSWISGDGYIWIAIIVFGMMLLYKKGTE